MIVTVPASSSITGGAVCLDGPAKESVTDFPLSAVKTAWRLVFSKYVPLPVSRKTTVPYLWVVPEKPQTLSGNVSEKCSTFVDPAARPVAAVTHARTIAMTSGRSFLRASATRSTPTGRSSVRIRFPFRTDALTTIESPPAARGLSKNMSRQILWLGR